ncbi:MAG TPA: hypothetical protein PLI90_00470 [Rhodocyclaceae bacterium]|nr:hypothetical protein [Rhodocyclaceae bacterium]
MLILIDDQVIVALFHRDFLHQRFKPMAGCVDFLGERFAVILKPGDLLAQGAILGAQTLAVSKELLKPFFKNAQIMTHT